MYKTNLKCFAIEEILPGKWSKFSISQCPQMMNNDANYEVIYVKYQYANFWGQDFTCQQGKSTLY